MQPEPSGCNVDPNARRLGVKALTSDTAWSQIASAVEVEIELIR
jgi:hypothetical protein